MQPKELDELLEKNFSNVNSWLNFAEAKNAANIAFGVASIAAIFSLQNMNVIMYILCIFLIASSICSLLSFLPSLGSKVEKSNCYFGANEEQKVDGDNLIFFETLKKYSGDDYIQQVCKIYFNENKYSPTKYQLDLSDELVYNSNIVSRKYKFFKKAVYLDIIAFLLLAISMVLA